MRSWFLVIPLSLMLTMSDAAAEQSPILRYTPPANTFRQGLATPEDYTFNAFNGSVQLYPFRPFDGDIQQAFQTTLLREWISPLNQEQNVGGQPTFQVVAIPGAEQAMAATFSEVIVGVPKPHVRMLIVADGMAAIVDASATQQSWPQAAEALNAMAATLRVEMVRTPPPLRTDAGRSMAGLYAGTKPKYMAPRLLGMPSSYQVALHFYLFSADGRVYRAYDQLQVPGGNVALFDFDAAERSDPENSGRYTIDGANLVIQMRGAAPETIVAPIPQNGVLTIDAARYERQ